MGYNFQQTLIALLFLAAATEVSGWAQQAAVAPGTPQTLRR